MKNPRRVLQRVDVVPGASVADRAEHGPQLEPVFLQPPVLLLQPAHVLHKDRISGGHKLREDVSLLVLVARAGRGGEEVTDALGQSIMPSLKMIWMAAVENIEGVGGKARLLRGMLRVHRCAPRVA